MTLGITRGLNGVHAHRSLFREYAELLLIAVLLALFARTFLVQAYEIPSGSMETNLLVGDHVVINKFIFAPARTWFERWLLPQRRVRRGDVVVFRFPGDPTRQLIKRCVATAGDRVAIANKVLLLDGQPLAEPYARHLDPNTYPGSRFLHETLRYRDNLEPLAVPPGQLFCLGDNRDFSHDSRFWGTVPEDHVRGRAMMIYWSQRPDPGSGGPSSASGRWRRSFRLVR